MTGSVTSRDFSYTTGTKVQFDATNNQIKTITKQDGTTVTGVFDGLRAGQILTAAGAANNSSGFTISAVSADGSTVTVSDDITVDEVDPNATLDVYAAAGTITSSGSYYGGDTEALTHRVDATRTINMDVTAADPAFEKAIRAMSILAQGVTGTEGGLDNNRGRINDALYLLNDALDSPAPGSAPFGAEESGDFQKINFDLGFKMVALDNAKTTHEAENTVYNDWIGQAEDIDPLEAITKLIDQQNSLEASYRAVSDVMQMSLVNYLK